MVLIEWLQQSNQDEIQAIFNLWNPLPIQPSAIHAKQDLTKWAAI